MKRYRDDQKQVKGSCEVAVCAPTTVRIHEARRSHPDEVDHSDRGVRTKIADLQRLERTLSEVSARCTGGDVPECPIVDALFEASLR